MSSTRAERAAQLAVIEAAVASTFVNPRAENSRRKIAAISDAVHLALTNAGYFPEPGPG